MYPPILFLLLFFSATVWAQPGQGSAAEKIYRQGILPSGEFLHGEREMGVAVQGAEAACVNCHRRSGLGTLEGRILIPPVTGKYLFRNEGSRGLEDMDYRFGTGINANREPYTADSLARAIREGIGRQGQKLNPLMPRYQLDDAAMAALVSYLSTLSTTPEPGVSNDTLHFATIITPDADPLKRKGMLEVLERFFNDKNEFLRGGRRVVQSPVHVKYRVTRRWQLHVWQLSGPPQQWLAQLEKYQEAEPVFAVISGLGGKTWEPVHRFCEQAAIPCLMPNVDAPPDAQNDFYSIYINKGVSLEAGLIAESFEQNGVLATAKRVVQIYREGDVGAQAATALASAGGLAKEQSVIRVLRSGASARELAAMLKQLDAADILILWLRARDLQVLPAQAPNAGVVYVSGLMGGLENSPIPASWRPVVHMSYPLDLPELRKARMNFPLGWLKIRNIPLLDELVQANTYLACGILAETTTEMLDSFVRDYMLERIESMVSYRTVTGHYPRLGLAPGQRFMSKGGYIVHFAEPAGNKLVADSEWLIP